MSRKVLIVCHGNLNRSAAGEIILRKMHPEWKVRSAGFTHDGRITAKKMRQALAECGYEETSIRSTVITKELVAWADQILYMDDKNEDRLFTMYGFDCLLKAKNLGHLIDLDKIPDPHFAPTHEAHIRVIQMLERAFKEL